MFVLPGPEVLERWNFKKKKVAEVSSEERQGKRGGRDETEAGGAEGEEWKQKKTKKPVTSGAVILAPERQRQGPGYKFEASQGYIVRPYLRNINIRKNL